MTFACALFLITTPIIAQNQPNLVQILKPLLNQAGHPLTESQIQQLNQLQPGPEMQSKLVQILKDEQLAALQQQSSGNQNQEMAMAQVLDQAGEPLTEDQISDIQNIEQGPQARSKMVAILTDEQIVALREYMENQSPSANIPKVLNNGGEPLSVKQMRELNSMAPNQDVQAQLLQILTDAQNDILEDMSQGAQ